ncbi:heat shock STI [Haematococcus lacustris]|uniref:Heat shock STI n=1 Tax=Haematococcus lacustris TaxID=44745 RepID=A0A699ZCU8_HAELA|nr:heat shock STI [Haematococcus lacustris]
MEENGDDSKEAAAAKAEAAKKAEALKEKELGNQAYKAKRFEEAIQHYNRALELYDKDISFITNRVAAERNMHS